MLKEKYIIMLFFVSMMGLQLWVADAQSRQVGNVPPLVGLALLKIAQHEELKKAASVVSIAQTQKLSFVWYNPLTWF